MFIQQSRGDDPGRRGGYEGLDEAAIYLGQRRQELAAFSLAHSGVQGPHLADGFGPGASVAARFANALLFSSPGAKARVARNIGHSSAIPATAEAAHAAL